MTKRIKTRENKPPNQEIAPRKRQVTELKSAKPQTSNLALTIDWDLYGQYLENSNLSDAEKRETIEALWSIVVSFVDLGFGIHPAQLANKDCCEQNGTEICTKPVAVIDCMHTTTKEFAANATGYANEGNANASERSPE